MQREISTKSRIILTVLFGITGIFLFVYILVTFQSRLARKTLEEEMTDNGSYICETYSSYELKGSVLEMWADDVHRSYLFMVMHALEEHPELIKSGDDIAEFSTLINLQDMMIVNKDGRVVSSAIGYFKEMNYPLYTPLLESFEDYSMKKVAVFPYSDKTMDERVNAFLEELDGGNAEQKAQDTETSSEEENEDGYSDWNSTYYGLSNPFPVLYSLAVGDNLACIINDYGALQLSYEAMTDAWTYTLKNEVIGSGGFAFVWSADTGKILYYPDGLFRNEDISALGIDVTAIQDKQFVTQKVNGTSMYLYPVYFEEQNAWVVCGVPSEELSFEKKPMTYLMWMIFAMLAADLVYYAVLLLNQKKMAAEEQFHPALRQKNEIGRKRKLLTFTLFCTVVVSLSSFYLQTLYLMSDWSENSSAQIAKIETQQKEHETLMTGIRQLYQENAEKLVKLAGWYVGKNPEETAPEDLDILTAILNLDNLWITDENGAVTAASSSYLPPSSAQTEEKDASGSETEEKPSEPADPASKKLNISVPLKNESGNITGYINGEYRNVNIEELLAENGLSSTLKGVHPGEGAFVFAVNQESKKFTWHPDTSLAGKSALDYGLTETDLQDNLCQYIKLNRETYYAVTGKYEGDIIFMNIPKKKLLQKRLPITITLTITAVILLLVIGIWVYTCPEAEFDRGAEDPEAEHPEGRHEKKTTPEFKVFRNLAFSLVIIGAVILLISLLRPEALNGSILEYVRSGNWERGLNVFAFTASLIVVLEGGLALFVLRRLTDIMTAMLTIRARTVIQMIASLVSYVVGFILLYQCLVYLGMDPTALMTSAGIVSVVIGIGANSLVGDILAGIFLLIEGNIQVGDMISIGDFRGIVEDLGIRMTKIYDVDSEDIKIIPNKEVENVVHMSAHPANLFLEYQICYEEDLERVEKLLVEELKRPEGRIPEIIGELKYLGVRRLDDSAVVLLVRARCHEAYRPRVTRAVNRKIYMMFKKNGIEIPFPQLTVHTEDE